MPPKGKKGQDKGKSGEEERDEPLQAVVSSASASAAIELTFQILADPFETRFSPFTLERPRVCTPPQKNMSDDTDTHVVLAAPRQHPAHRIHV
jgi:hypothetical protein